MKVYVSADIEGVTGTAHWNEVTKIKPDYEKFADQMTKEVKAACEGANAAGAEEILIKDAHSTARNINIEELPLNVKIIRGWSRHPYMMMQEIDDSFDAAIMIGYHSFAGSNGSPLAHTMDEENINYIKINGEIASEFTINSYIAAYVGVPVVFVSGDELLCKHAENLSENIKTVSVKKGVGDSIISIHPTLAIQKIKTGVEESLKGNLTKYNLILPKEFKVEISYIHHMSAYKASFYPGVTQISPTSVIFTSKDYFEVLRMMLFLV